MRPTVDSWVVPHECGVLRLLGPNGLIKEGCLISGSGAIDATVLPADGTYTVLVDPDAAAAGLATIALNTATDQRSTMAIDGPPVMADIRQKGAIASLTFRGTAGRRIFVEVRDATLPDECGILTLRGPGGVAMGGLRHQRRGPHR
jgi:hypothetical protein